MTILHYFTSVPALDASVRFGQHPVFICLSYPKLWFCCFSSDIELLREDFTSVEPTAHKLQKVKVILLLPRCSGLGVSNPIEFILNEHEGTVA